MEDETEVDRRLKDKELKPVDVVEILRAKQSEGKEVIEEEPPVKVAISIPTEGVTHPEAYDNRLMMAFHLGKLQVENPDKYEFFWYSAGSMLTPMAREQLALNAVANGADLIFMIDDDMLSSVDVFERLHQNMVENEEVDIVAPLAFTRNPPYRAVAYTIEDGYRPDTRQPYFQTKYIDRYPRDRLFECDAVGFGAVLIKTSVLHSLKEPYFMSTSPTGEDILFCMNARKIGARVFMDSRVKLVHLGQPTKVDEAYVDRWEKGQDINRAKDFSEYGKFQRVKLTPPIMTVSQREGSC
jgi:hypothetical protein